MLFWLVILMRYQWVSRLSGIVLARLSGAAFAFTENILYYGRVYRYAARTFGEVPPLEALQSLFMLRGVMTFFGHPLFTAMIGIGLAVAVRSKSKVVRWLRRWPASAPQLSCTWPSTPRPAWSPAPA